MEPEDYSIACPVRRTLIRIVSVRNQTVIDCHSRYAFGRLYTSKVPVTAVHILNTDVLPFFEAHGTPIQTILTDNGSEYCGRPDHHPYELFLRRQGQDAMERSLVPSV